jgi:hypothetical protein
LWREGDRTEWETDLLTFGRLVARALDLYELADLLLVVPHNEIRPPTTTSHVVLAEEPRNLLERMAT